MQDKIDEWVNLIRPRMAVDSLDRYVRQLRRLEQLAPGRPANEWTAEQISEHIAQLRAAGLAEPTIRLALTVYRRFFAYACPGHSPMPAWHKPGPPKRVEPPANCAMETKLAEWSYWLRMKVSKETAKSYEYHLQQLVQMAPGRGVNEWTTAQLLEYIAIRSKPGRVVDRSVPGMGEAMQKQVVSALRSFFGYARPGQSPAKDLPMPKIHRRKQRTLDADKALKVLASCDTSTDSGTRDLAIMTLMLDSGLRASEVCRLKLSKMDMVRRRFEVVTKGGDEEIGVFSRTTAANLSRWLSIREKYITPGVETLFVSFGGIRPGMPLTSHGLRGLFHDIGLRSGIGRFSPHDLRRTFATIAIRNGAPTRVVQAAGRWGDLSLVERYTQDIQAEDFERYSPVESLLKGRDE
jgi:integrase/recombinase XerD